MKKEVSKEYLKYMNNDGQCDKVHYEVMKSKEKTIIEYWHNKTKDDMCYNCSCVFVNEICPCRLRQMNNELELLRKGWF